MFNIIQSPYSPLPTEITTLVVFVQGSLMTINGEEFDFSFMEPGDSLPSSAIESSYFEGDVDCLDSGIIQVAIKVPVGPNATEQENFPPVLENKKYGKVIDIRIEPSVILEVNQNA